MLKSALKKKQNRKTEQRGERLLLCEDNGDRVVEDALTKHQHIEDWVHIEGVEDGNGRYRVHS